MALFDFGKKKKEAQAEAAVMQDVNESYESLITDSRAATQKALAELEAERGKNRKEIILVIIIVALAVGGTLIFDKK